MGKVEHLFMFKVISFSVYYTSSPFSFLGSWILSLFRCSLYVRDINNALGKNCKYRSHFSIGIFV